MGRQECRPIPVWKRGIKMAGAKEILFNEDGSYKTTEQYIAEIEATEAADIMADILILKCAADAIKKWQNPNRVNAAAVAIIECDLMASSLSHKLYTDHGIVA